MKSNNSNFDDNTIEKSKKVVISYLENNYENIEKVEFKKEHSSPMGSLVLEGKVNEKAYFNIGINNDFTIGSIGEGDGFPDLKDECREKTCDY
ncbi:DUF1433 domain-containing protein [Virgibacillus chiguensis]|uniref:Uncharacterized protein n=1 Tax=Virgibacillus chiguensis TaxID=411959 RepID=A0A1M5WVA8_9BACI|nr:DUF1433 domain-containing protein [Virgibacillus chiguensis]SHH91064.1 Protein of unknown function [Virgibacillus chiguensis]